MLADDLSKIASTKRKVVEHNFYVENVDNFEKLNGLLKEVALKGLNSIKISLSRDKQYTDVHITDYDTWRLERPLVKWVSNNYSMIQRVTGLRIHFPMILPTESLSLEEDIRISF